MKQSSSENGSFASENVNNLHLHNLVPLMNNKLPLSSVFHGTELLQFPKCFRSLEILYICTGFLPMIPCNNYSKLITLYTYFYRITLLGMPFYVLGLFSKQSNPLFASISRSGHTVVTISFCLLILNVFVTILFCIRHFKKHYLTLLYHSLAIDLNSDNDHCVKCITNTLRKTSNRITIIVLIFTIISFIQWIIGNRYLQTLSSHSHSNIFYTYIIPLLWAIQIWLPLFNCISLLYIIGSLLKRKADILIGRIHASNVRHWKISSFISKHPYSSINSDKLQPFDSWWDLMDSYIKLVTEYNDISSKWNLYLSITLIVIMSQSITVIIMLLQSSQLVLVAFIFSFQFIVILCVMFFVLARLSKQSNRILKIISMTDFGDNISQIEVMRIIELIKTNECTITIYGIQVTYGKAAIVAGSLISFISGSFTKFLIDALK
eukprot:156868_1